jgi:hypothetical protein
MLIWTEPTSLAVISLLVAELLARGKMRQMLSKTKGIAAPILSTNQLVGISTTPLQADIKHISLICRDTLRDASANSPYVFRQLLPWWIAYFPRLRMDIESPQIPSALPIPIPNDFRDTSPPPMLSNRKSRSVLTSLFPIEHPACSVSTVFALMVQTTARMTGEVCMLGETHHLRGM